MKHKRPVLLPKHKRVLEQLGERFKLARLRRKLSMKQIAERSNISKSTLWRIEKGDPGVSLGNFYQVLMALGLENDLSLLAADDKLGRKLQDAEISTKKRAPKKD